ncbi:MAG: response regulator transcription factor [Flavobacteriales bacterium]|nr:response regulator transcription factor [Flavobacteriia bacterium]NCP06778.1 response regulator transcription factor [Flavobacteriales bacterium]PIV92381.1 MAG: DNA-binding response regulator [Flavobacteriaceae bacterium CG17_big_fil_post_rev_8_21_14_2_50_33_15]PIY11222.1 MAG: DNA-binding response regulator [Flavobacteriaceae bacterium CG_4_10_14_3_um_filter_33_47]PJB20322.1 MAG: DNA-binding response regulator [Flavobacteriaceae bacterium CG_4_9_14_3_um_filter_33_16]
MITVAITDDHVMVVEGLKTMLNHVDGIKIINAYHTVNDTIKGLLEITPQVLLLDINLPDGNGILLCKQLKETYKDLKIIALSNYEDISFIKQIIKNGANGYLLKNTNKNELIEAIKAVSINQLFLPEKLQRVLLNDSLGKPTNSSFFIPTLTRREKEVLILIVKENTTEEIAEQLFITSKTVEAHRSNLIQKLGVKNVAGLVRVAIEKGLI